MTSSQSGINVVFIGNFPYPNGFAGTKRVQQYMDHLQSKNVPVSALILMGKPVLSGNEETEGEFRGTTYKVIGRDLRPDLQLPVRLFKYLRNGTRFLHSHRQSNVDNILFHYGQPDAENLWFLLLARRMGYRIVHDLVEDYDLLEEKYQSSLFNFKIWAKKKLIRFIPCLSDGLVVISRHLEKKYIGCGVPMVRIPIAAEVLEVIPGRPRHSPVRITYAGTFGRKDGIHVLLEAYQLVRREYPGCLLCLAGGNRSPLDDFPLELTAGVEYAGYLDDEAFYQFLSDADILCMTRLNSPYANAGFPFKLGEYLATGNPVVASRVSNLEDYLKDKRDALLVTPESVQELSDALLYLLKNFEKAREIGLNGRQVCLENFNPRINGEKLLEFLLSIMRKHTEGK